MYGFFNSLFGKKRQLKKVDDCLDMKKYLIVGLGNIGSEYENTRHNIGFKIVDFLAAKETATFETVRLGDLARFNLKGRNLLLIKPSTYMNLSGKAVKYWLEKEKIPLENLLVVADDLNLPFGSIRIKSKGSDGGHNGLKDIQNQLNTTTYSRLRFGIGNNFGKGNQVNYVMGNWEENELQQLPERLDTASEAVKSFVLSGINQTMNTFNGK